MYSTMSLKKKRKMRGVKIHIKKNDKTMNRFMRCNEDFKMISSSNFLFLLNDIEEGFLE